MAFKKMVNKLFTKYLYVTNCTGIACVMAIGDTMEQRIVRRMVEEDNCRDQDWGRTGRMAIAGVPMGTVAHFWYGWLDRRFPGRALRPFVKKMAWDTGLGVFLQNIPVFFTIGLLEGLGVKESAKSSITKMPAILVGEIMFWTPMQVINFYYIPPRFRVMYMGVIATFWTAYMSYVQHEYGSSGEDETTKPQT